MKARLSFLGEDPFALATDPRSVLASSSFQAAIERLAQGVERRAGLLAVIGGAGGGTTTLLQAFQTKLQREGGVGLLRLAPDTSLGELMGSLRRDLAIRRQPQRPIALLLDEAHRLSDTALREIARLAERRADPVTGLQIVLAGQPTLEERLRAPELAAVAACVAEMIRLEPLSREDLAAYVVRYLAAMQDGREARAQIGPTTDKVAMERVAAPVQRAPRPILNIARRAARAAEAQAAATPAPAPASAIANQAPPAPAAALAAAPPPRPAAVPALVAEPIVPRPAPRSVARRRTPLRAALFATAASAGLAGLAAAYVTQSSPELGFLPPSAPSPDARVSVIAAPPSGDLAARGEIERGDNAVTWTADVPAGAADADAIRLAIAETAVAIEPVQPTALPPEPTATRAAAEPAIAPAEAAAPASEPGPSLAALTPASSLPPAPPQPEITAIDPTPPAPRAARPAATAETPSVDIHRLMVQGHIMLEQADPASARLFFQRAATQGHTVAMRAVGQTFDPTELQRLNIVGMSGDANRALEWYRRAAEAGDPAAGERLAALGEWLADRKAKR